LTYDAGGDKTSLPGETLTDDAEGKVQSVTTSALHLDDSADPEPNRRVSISYRTEFRAGRFFEFRVTAATLYRGSLDVKFGRMLHYSYIGIPIAFVAWLAWLLLWPDPTLLLAGAGIFGVIVWQLGGSFLRITRERPPDQRFSTEHPSWASVTGNVDAVHRNDKTVRLDTQKLTDIEQVLGLIYLEFDGKWSVVLPMELVAPLYVGGPPAAATASKQKRLRAPLVWK
jgi:hypothetical protein